MKILNNMNTKKPFKYAFVVGRFQPLHLGHEQMIKEALKQAENVIVFLGSSQESGTKKNPLTPEQRQYLFYETFKEDMNRFTFVPLPDTPTDQTWAISIMDKLSVIVKSGKLCNVCFDKDYDTTQSNNLLQYLWQSTRIAITPIYPSLSATDVRRIVLEDKVCPLQLVGTYLSPRAAKALKDFRDSSYVSPI